MKKIVTGLVLLSLGSSMALAGDYYGGVNLDFGKGGEEWIENGTTKYDFSNTSYGLHLGYNLNKNSMVELSFKSLTFDFKNNNLSDEDGTQFGIDYLYAFDTTSELKIKPYLGIGLNVNSKDISVEGLNEDSIDGFGLKIRVGGRYSLTPKLDLGVDLNYNMIGWQDLQNNNTDSTAELSTRFYALGLNINYKF